MDYVKKFTSAEVCAVIWARHSDELVVFSSFSAPEGDYFGDPNQCVMETEYGFSGAPAPLIGYKTTWEKIPDSYEHKNEKHTYWLCIAEGGKE